MRKNILDTVKIISDHDSDDFASLVCIAGLTDPRTDFRYTDLVHRRKQTDQVIL